MAGGAPLIPAEAATGQMPANLVQLLHCRLQPRAIRLEAEAEALHLKPRPVPPWQSTPQAQCLAAPFNAQGQPTRAEALVEELQTQVKRRGVHRCRGGEPILTPNCRIRPGEAWDMAKNHCKVTVLAALTKFFLVRKSLGNTGNPQSGPAQDSDSPVTARLFKRLGLGQREFSSVSLIGSGGSMASWE